MFDLNGRKALITGAGQGMGLGIAKALKGAGAKVYINDLYKDRAEFAANKIGAIAVSGDITDTNVRESFLEITNGVDILINNAGVPVEMPTSLNQAEMLKENDYQRQLDLNFNSIRGLCMLFLPTMKIQKHGRIVIITSESHRLGFSMGLSHYAAAKSAALGYMRQLAAEIGHYGVTINALSLGSMNNFEGHERAAQTTIVGRAGTPEDVGAASLYLCSDEASWITGQTIPLNGGACTA